MTVLTDTLNDIHTRTAYALAADADTHSPDSLTSVGAGFLDTVRVATLEAVENGSGVREEDDSDTAHELADSCVPVYTYTTWQVFTDLCAWQEEDEAGELAGDEPDMTRRAMIALYVIARRLVDALLSEVREAPAADQAEAALPV